MTDTCHYCLKAATIKHGKLLLCAAHWMIKIARKT
jgi:hypothetical protein